MTGRHALNREAALDALNSPAGRGVAAAMAVGTMLGVSLPAANADEAATVGKLAPVSDIASTKLLGTEKVTATADASWDLEQVTATPAAGVEASITQTGSIEVEALPAAQQPAARTASNDDAAAPAASDSYVVESTEAAPPVSYEGSGTGSSVLSTAMNYIGSPYRWAGTTPAGWDCIGFVRYVYAQYGVNIGTYTTSVLSVGRQVSYSEAQPGDILYWPGHVAIYAGGGSNVGAWNAGMDTRVGPNSWVSGATPIVIRVFG